MALPPLHHTLLSVHPKRPCDQDYSVFGGNNQWPRFLHSHRWPQSLNTEESNESWEFQVPDQRLGETRKSNTSRRNLNPCTLNQSTLKDGLAQG